MLVRLKRIKQNRSHCSHGPVGRLPSVKSSAEMDWPQAGDYKIFEITFGDRAPEVCDELRAAGVLVRDRTYELAGCMRVTVGTREQTGRLVTELERIWP